MENIQINNFLTINKADINLKKINIFIGPQAQGKSVIAKLIKYFKDYPTEILKLASEGKTKRDIIKGQKVKFFKIFPQQYWENDAFEIIYSNKHYSVCIQNKDKSSFKITISDELTKTINKLRQITKKDMDYLIGESVNGSIIKRKKIDIDTELRSTLSNELFSAKNTKIESVLYIPAGRSFFANLQKNVFSFLSSNIDIDYFLTEFGSIYEQTKSLTSQKIFTVIGKEVPSQVNKLVEELICGKYSSEKGEDWITQHNKKININNSSSGQQESLPMALMLSTWPYIKTGFGRSFIIEEPEAHLFPSAQSVVVSLIANAYNRAESYCSYTITTHSPYILSAMNNLIQAGNTLAAINSQNNNNEQKNNLFKIVPESQLIDFNDVTAYMVNNGKVIGILDSELKILDSNEIDRISSIFSDNFDKLIEMEFSVSENSGE
ncbi:AAA family ATPase [Serratia marcescens]|uniref:AAA family ATPase n=1 Tax=Serratia marcescens TaxID=615 RepID=UPI0034E887E7